MRLVSLPVVLYLLACDPSAGVIDAGDLARDAGPRDADAVDAAARDAEGPDAGAGPARDAGAPGGLVVLSLNLRCLELEGTPYRDHAGRFDAIASACEREAVDALLLQEVCEDGVVDALAALEEALEEVTGEGWSAAAAFAHVAWEGTARQADESVAILARGELGAVTARTHHAQGGLRRATVAANLDGGLRVVSTHLDFMDAAVRGAQAREVAVAALVDAGSSDVLVGGDLNGRTGGAAWSALADAGFVDAAAALPPDRIDHVLVHRGAAFRGAAARALFDTPEERVSDHPGVLVRLAPAAPAPVTVTRITARVDVGFGRRVTVRGDRAPLSWELGQPLVSLAADRWAFASTEIDGRFRFKLLRDDVDWQSGDDLVADAGDSVEVTPEFPAP